jgi:hypothetical protein
MIATLYRDNPFHNFEHACHVVMATKKLLCRVIQPSDSFESKTAYGITSDNLVQFGIVFSALIHDVDHPGVSNAQLVKEKAEVSILYHNQSVAEQNSVTLAWNFLMQDKFIDLRNAIMPTTDDCKLFRQIIVNAVMATDLFDKDLKVLRENRWNKAFDTTATTVPTPIFPFIFDKQNKNNKNEEDMNRRATIIIEHIIQASDVSHTMQHWHVYQLWNRRLFFEMYDAYVGGRAEKDPADSWYEGEIWFFDNYIIPLAKKLKTCGVFGVSCDELLDYATDNRNEWEAKGREIVAEYVSAAQTASSQPHCNRNNNNSSTSMEQQAATAAATSAEGPVTETVDDDTTVNNSSSFCQSHLVRDLSTSITIEFESDSEVSISTGNDGNSEDDDNVLDKQAISLGWEADNNDDGNDQHNPSPTTANVPYGM